MQVTSGLDGLDRSTTGAVVVRPSLSPEGQRAAQCCCCCLVGLTAYMTYSAGKGMYDLAGKVIEEVIEEAPVMFREVSFIAGKVAKYCLGN